jgi:hypothetical protein
MLESPSTGKRTDEGIGGVDAFVAGKRLELLWDEHLISLSEKLDWEARVDAAEVPLDEIEALFHRLWPWKRDA